MSERRHSTFDNTTLILTFSEQERDGKKYYRCLPDLHLEVSMLLSECHLIFDPVAGQLRISRNRNLT